MKIAYFIDAMNIGGTESHLQLTIDSLDRLKIVSYLFCLRPADKPVATLPKCPYFELGVSSFKRPSTWMKLLKVAIWLRRHRIDIVQTYFPDASFFGLLAARLARLPVTILCRRDAGHWLPKPQLRRYRFLNHFADYHLVNADFIKQMLVRDENVNADRIAVAPNAIDVSLFQRRSDHFRESARRSLGLGGGLVVGTVANLNREVKRVDVFIRAAAEVAKVIPEVEYVIIGDGHLKQGMKRLAENLGLNGKMHFLGSRTDVPFCLAALDVAVNTSDSEGLSNSIIEYMAMGLPIVATDVGGNKELLDSCGSLVPGGDSQAISAAILSYLAQEQKRRQDGMRARVCVEARYDQKVTVEKLVDFYGGVLLSRP